MLLEKKRLIEEFTNLLRKYSPTGNEAEAINYIAKLAKSYGYEEVYVDEIGNLHAIYGNGPLELALIPHVDTVPGEINVQVVNEKIYGRGAVDAKGPLYAMLVGAALVKRHVEDEIRVHFIAEVGEEGDSRGARYLISKGFKPSSIIIGEPSSTTGVVIAYRGSIHLKIECSSKGGHPASPMQNMSAYEKFLNVWSRISKEAPGTFYDIPQARITFIRAGDSYNKLPEKLIAYVDIRVPSPNKMWNEDFNMFHRKIKSIIENNDCSVKTLGITKPVRVSPNTPIVRAVMRAIIRNGKKPILLRKYGSSDMNLFYNMVKDIVAYGPGNSALSHSSNEFISLSDLIFGIKVYANAIKEYAYFVKVNK